MKEQSHKDEMASALRGDFARLRSRGVATTLAPRDGERVGPASVPAPAPAPAAAPVASSPLEPAPDAVAEPAASERPWIARFLGSR